MRNQWETDLHKFITPYLKALTNNIQRRWAPLYLRGLLSRSRRKSIYPLAGTIAIGRFQNLHHFVNVASWNTHPLETLLAQQAQELVGGKGSILIIDDMTLLKAGRHSVGVARQYSGRAGKRENCQALVSLTLARREVPIPIALRLFLPEEWSSNQERCAAAGVPVDRRDHHHTKGLIALAEIDRVRQAGIETDVVVADAGYGTSAPFRQALSERGLLWAVGVPKHQNVYPPNVDTTWPPSGRRGRPRKHPIVTMERFTIEEYLAASSRSWRSVTWRRGTKGKLKAEFVAVRVKVADGEQVSMGRHLPGSEAWLVGEQRADGKKKYYLSNLPAETKLVDLARVIKARWACEQGHEQLNQEVGLSHFEGRSWLGLHHHALLAMLAFCFLQFSRLRRAFYRSRHGPPPSPSLPEVRRALLEHLHEVRCRCPCCGVLVSVPATVTK